MKPIILGGTNGVTLLYPNPTTPANSMEAEITNAFNSGLKVGDIRGCWLANSLTANSSVKTATLTNGTGNTLKAVATGASLQGMLCAGANTNSAGVLADTNFTSELFSVSFWYKRVAGGVGGICGNMSYTTSGWYIYDNNVNLEFHFETPADAVARAPLTTSGVYTHVVFVRTATGSVKVYYDGVLQTAAITGTIADIVTATAAFDVAGTGGGANPLALNSELALVRPSATAPTAEQIKHMYETERKLFEPNAQALLSNSASVTDLRYDKKSGMYAVTNGTNTDLFKDLVRVDSAATSATIATPVTTLSGNRVLAPAVDIGSELSTIKTVHNRRRVLLDFNVVVNGKFSRASGWTLGGGWSISGGQLVAAAASGLTTWSNNITVKNAVSYTITYTILNRTAGSVYMQLEGSVVGTSHLIDGTYTEILKAAGTGFVYIGSSSFSGAIDNLFIRESTDTLPRGFKPTKVWAGGLLQEEGTDYDVTFDGFLYGINFFIEPATNVQVEGEYI